MNILITGRPGVGKTTLVKELVEKLRERAGGFYTEEMRNDKGRTGFKIKTLDGKEGILASVNISGKHRVGRYKVNTKDLEGIAIPSIESAIVNSKIIIIDEIGPMELFSQKFKDAVLKALDSPNPVITTIKEKGSNFVTTLKSRQDVVIYTLTDNKKEILEKITSQLSN